MKDAALNILIKAKDLASESILKLKKNLSGIDSTADKASGALSDVEKGAGKIDGATDGASDSLDKLNKSAKKTDDIADSASDSLDDVGKSAKKAGDSSRKASEGLQKAAKSSGDLDKAATKTAKGGLARIKTAALATVGAFLSFQTIRRVFNSVISTGDKFERLGIQIESAMGSVEKGEQATAWIKDFTKNTPLQLEQVTEAFITLKNFGLDPQEGTLQAIVDQNEKLGGGYERLMGITRALGQAQAKQKLQGEEILQLVERGVPVWDLLSKATGKSTAELSKLSQQGKLGKDVIQQLVVAMGEAASGSAQKNMSTWAGLVSNLKDRWAEFLNTVAESGALDYAKDQLTVLSKRIAELAKNGTLKEWAKKVSDAMVSIAEGTKSVVSALYSARYAIGAYAAAWSAVKLSEYILRTSVLAHNIGVKLVNGTVKATAAMGGLGNVIKGIGWAGVAYGIAKVVDAFDELKKARKDLSKSIKSGAKVEDEATERLRLYQEQTGYTAASLDDLQALVDEGSLVFNNANKRWIQGYEAVKKFNEGLHDTSDSAKNTAQDLRSDLKRSIDDIVESFEKVKEESLSTSQALDGIFKSRNINITQDVQSLMLALDDLAAEGKATGDEIKEALSRALSGLSTGELERFKVNAIYAFGEAKDSAVAFGAAMEAIADNSLDSMGLSVEALKQGVTEAELKAIQSVENIKLALSESGQSADVISSGIALSFKRAFSSAQSDAAKSQLLDSFKKAYQEGKVSAEEYHATIKEVGATTESNTDKNDRHTESTKRQTRETKNLAEETRRLEEVEKRRATRMAGLGSLITAVIGGHVNALKKLSSQAVDTWRQMALGVKQTKAPADELTANLKKAQEQIQNIQNTTIYSRLGKWFENLALQSAKVREEFYRQAISVRDLQRSYSEGALGAEEYIKKAQFALESSNLLDQQTLDGLREGIAAARQEMESLGDSAEDTLNSLQDELDRLKGNTDAIKERQYQERLSKLEADLAAARKAGNEEAVKDLTDALSIAKEIYETDKRNRQEAAAERKEKERAAKQREAEKSSAPKPSNSPQTINLKINGKSAKVDTESPEALLDLLTEAGFTTE